jgi:hypothetical protein
LDNTCAALAGVTVTLTGTNYLGQSVTETTTTNANGSYSFTGLLVGTYSITETPPSQYVDAQNMIGSLGGTLSADAFLNITLTAGANGTSYGFDDLSTS